MIPVFEEEMERMKKSSSRSGRLSVHGGITGVEEEGAALRAHLSLGVIATLVAVFAFFALASSAFAAASRPYESSFGSFTDPEAVTVDQSTGDVYVVDIAAGTVSRFSAAGVPVEFSATKTNFLSGFIFEANAAQVAVAPAGSPGGTAGDVYVVSSLTDNVEIFDANGNHVGELNGSGNADGGFGEACGVAIEASTGAVYVGEYDNHHVWRYTPTTGTVTEANYTGGIETPAAVCNVAADGGSVYAGNTYEAGELMKYQAFSFVKGSPPAPTPVSVDATATAVATDPSNGDVYVDEGERISVFDASGASLYTFGSAADFGANSAGVGVKGSNGKAYVADRVAGEIDVFSPAANLPPIASTNPATTIHHTDAILNGHLAPGTDSAGATDPITDCHFDWGTTTSYTGGTVPCKEGNSFGAAADVTANLGNLTPGTAIHFRLNVTATATGTATGADQTFTPTVFPVVHVTIAAFGPDGTSATSFDGGNVQLAFDQSNLKLYALSYTQRGVYGFDASAPPAYPPLPGFSPLGLPNNINSHPGVAVGTGGDVYVASEGTGGSNPEFPAIVYGFGPSSAGLGGAFPIDPAITPGTPSGGPSKELCGIATDTTGNIWVANRATKYVLKYNSAGVFQSALDVSAHGSPCDLAFDSNDDLYVDQNGEVWRYTAASSYATSTQAAATGGNAIAVDRSTHRLYVARSTEIDEYESSGSLRGVFATGINNANFKGVTVDETNHYIYVDDEGNGKIRVFGPGLNVKGPTVTPGEPTLITGASATLNAKVDPETFTVTDCHFEYGTSTSYGHTAPCAPNPGSGSGDVAVSAALPGLASGTVYHFRIVAANANSDAETTGVSTGPDQTFATLGAQVHGAGADQITTTGARLSSQVNPEGKASTYHFDYGTTTSYGSSTPESLSLGSDSVDHAAIRSIAGLTPGATYHFRIVTANSDATTFGLDATFTTYPAVPSFSGCENDALRGGPGARLPDCRAYEQASPVEKNGSGVSGDLNFIQAAADGHAVDYYDSSNLPTSGGSSEQPLYVASRGASSWSSDGLLPSAGGVGKRAYELGWNDGFTTAFSYVEDKVGGGLDLYDVASAIHRQATATPSLTRAPTLAAFAADPSHLIFESRDVLASGGVEGKYSLYDLDHGAVTLAGRVPSFPATSCDDSGGPACIAPAGGSFAGSYDSMGPDLNEGGAHPRYYTQNTISADGSKVFFTEGGTGRLYMREHGTSTVQISASQTSPDPNGHKPAAFMAATPSGSKVFFTSCEKLTDDSTAVSSAANDCTTSSQGQDLYSYDTSSGDLTDITVDSNVSDSERAAVQGVLGASEDGSYVYFMANGVLAPGATRGNCELQLEAWIGTCNLYLSHNGAATFITRLSGNDDGPAWEPNYAASGTYGGATKESRVSQNGTLAFISRGQLTGYDNTEATTAACGGGSPSCRELYRYRPGDAALTCVSCNPTGKRPAGNSTLTTGEYWNSESNSLGTILTRNMSANGDRVFFDSKDALLAADTNGVGDVYEWEANGSGSCSSSAVSGGCLYLLSTGTSSQPSYFADASVSGNDVFLFTDSPLVPADQDQLLDVYDARVGGGLVSQHQTAPPVCSGDACRGVASSPPLEQNASSSVFSGMGDLLPPASRPVVQAKARAVSRTQKLAKALSACRKKPKKQRATCNTRARKRYGAVKARKQSANVNRRAR